MLVADYVEIELCGDVFSFVSIIIHGYVFVQNRAVMTLSYTILGAQTIVMIKNKSKNECKAS